MAHGALKAKKLDLQHCWSLPYIIPWKLFSALYFWSDDCIALFVSQDHSSLWAIVCFLVLVFLRNPLTFDNMQFGSCSGSILGPFSYFHLCYRFSILSSGSHSFPSVQMFLWLKLPVVLVYSYVYISSLQDFRLNPC